MPRVTVSAWLRTIESSDGPLPEELRHVCLSLARFLSGDGSAGCYPGTRKLAIRVGVSHTAVSRRLKLLRNAGWLDVEPRGRGFIYFPAVPDGTLRRSSRERGNGNPERATRVTPERATPMERSTRELERLSVTDSLTDSLTEGAASPARGGPRSAAPRSEPEQRSLRVWVADLRGKGQAPKQIAMSLERWYPGLTAAEVEAMP
jgi:DNA-binding transcriptional ArsR family regulator